MLNPMPQSDLSSFSKNYPGARQKLLDAFQAVSPDLQKSHGSYSHPLKGPHDEELACDTLYLGRNEQADRLLVLTSATHGVEGFAGSAIQTDCLGSLETQLLEDEGLGLLIIHAMNPWGFAWLRRYDHQGIDLNRNFIDFTQTLPVNQDFEQHLPALHNPDMLSIKNIEQLWQSSSESSFIDAVTRGQYQYNTSCFYGGNAPSWSRQVLEQITDYPQVTAANKIAVIDLHTGLGPYGYGEVINDHLPETQGFAHALNWYGDNAQSTVLGDACSTVKTGLIDYHWHEVLGDRGCFITLEFGTFPIKHLWLSLLSEQLYNNNTIEEAGTRDLQHPSVIALKKFFYPEETSWQQQVLFRGRQICELALAGMKQ